MPAAEALDPPGRLDDRVRVAAREVGLDLEHVGEVAVYGPLRQPLGVAGGTPEPSGADRLVAPQQVVDAEVQRDQRRGALVTLDEISAVRLLEEADAVVHVPEPPGALGQGVEIVGGQWAVLGCRAEAVARRVPRPPGVRSPSRIQRSAALRHVHIPHPARQATAPRTA